MYSRSSIFPNRRNEISYFSQNTQNTENIARNNTTPPGPKFRRSLDGDINVKKLEHDGYKWLADGKEISFEKNQTSPIRITNSLCANKNEISPILKRVSSCSLMKLELANQTISDGEFAKLISSRNIHCLNFNRVTVTDENNQAKKVDEILRELSNLQSFEYTFKDNEITPETAQSFACLPHFSNLRDFVLYEISEAFNFEVFSEFIKKHPNAEFTMIFRCSSEHFDKINIIKNDFSHIYPLISLKIVKSNY